MFRWTQGGHLSILSHRHSSQDRSPIVVIYSWWNGRQVPILTIAHLFTLWTGLDTHNSTKVMLIAWLLRPINVTWAINDVGPLVHHSNPIATDTHCTRALASEARLMSQAIQKHFMLVWWLYRVAVIIRRLSKVVLVHRKMERLIVVWRRTSRVYVRSILLILNMR